MILVFGFQFSVFSNQFSFLQPPASSLQPFVFILHPSSLFYQSRVEPVGVVQDVGAVGVVDDQVELLCAGKIDADRRGLHAAADGFTGELFLAVDENAKSHAAAAGRRVIDGQLGLESLIGLIQVVGQSGRAVHADALQV